MKNVQVSRPNRSLELRLEFPYPVERLLSHGMICSGEQTIILKKLGPKDSGVVEAILGVGEKKGFAVELTPEAFAVTTAPASTGFKRSGEDRYTYRERIGHENDLFIIGGGHCALALSAIMFKLGFRVTVFDDRPNLNTLVKNRFADRVCVVGSYQEIGEALPSGDNKYVVVMTLGYKYDKVVIQELLAKDFRYFGVLGSKAKMAVLMRELIDEGHDPGRLGAIRTPAGVDINSRTPEEIAVSIAAEIISVKNKA